jgi:hypothetical protein
MRSKTPIPDQIDVLYVIFDVGLTLENSAVFQSQVLDQLLAMHSFELSVSLVAMYNDPGRFKELVGNKLDDREISFVALKAKNFAGDFFSMAFALREFRGSTRRAYVRGLWGPLLLKLANIFNPIPYNYDVRGDLKDEFNAVKSSTFKQKIYLKLEAWGIRNASSISAVTKVLADKVSKEFGKNVSVIPCCINYNLYNIDPVNKTFNRARLGFGDNDIVFVYSGGLSHYQQVPAMLKLWAGFINRPNIKFLLLTNEDPHSHPVTLNDLNQFGKKLTHLSVPRSDIPQILSLANIGFMLRDSRNLNNAASPVKFPEYLASGLAVAASPGTGDASGLIIAHQLGVLIDPLDLEAGTNQLNNFLINLVSNGQEVVAKKSQMIAKEYYDWSSFKELLLKLYSVNQVESSL